MKSRRNRILNILKGGLITLSTVFLSFFLCAYKIAPFASTEDEQTVVDIALMAVVGLFVVILLIAIAFIVFVIKDKRNEKKIAVEIMEKTGTKGNKHAKANGGSERFPMLSEIDRQHQYNDVKVQYDTPSLKEICEGFRNYSAGKLGLYYSIEDIRSFVAGLGTCKFIIMQGISGTGKTSLAYAFGRFLSNPSRIIPVQPMWKESSDMLGYFNEFTGLFNETNMLMSLYEANYTESMCITVLDEMNISRIEYYFAEFLSLMELPRSEERKIRITSGVRKGDPKKLINGELHLPDNMWFIGTANNDDSTFAISDKVYDRAMIVELNDKGSRFDAPETSEMKIQSGYFDLITSNAEKAVKMSAEGSEKLKKIDKFLKDKLHVTFGNRIMRQISRYVAVYVTCGGDEESAIDDILSKKVLRKLETQNPIYISGKIDELNSCIDTLYGDGALPRCRKVLERLKRG